MGRGRIEIPIAADTSGFEKSIRNGLVEPLDDAEDGFKKLGKAAEKVDLDKDIAKAEKATKELDDELDKTRAGLSKLGYAANKVGDDSASGFGKASENVEEFKSEAAQNFSEVTSSFNGEMSSMVDLAQGTLGGLASGIAGPLGLALGVAAAGIGLVAGGLEQAAEHQEELRLKALEFANAASDAGMSVDEWASGAEQIVERLRELEETKSSTLRFFWEDDPSQLQEWSDSLKRVGRGADEIGRVLEGSTDAVRDYRREIRGQAEDLEAAVKAQGTMSYETYDALQKQQEALAKVGQYLDDEIAMREAAGDAAGRLADAGESAALRRVESEQKVAEATEAVRDSVADAYDSMRDDATEFATAEDGALDINRWLEYTQQHQGAVEAYKANIEAIRLSPEQWANLLEMPEDARMQWVAQFAALPEDARQPFADALNDVGSGSGKQAAVAFDDSFEPDAEVTAKADTDRAAKQLDDVARKSRTADIKANLVGEGGVNRQLDHMARDRSATLRVYADTGAAAMSVDAFIRRQESKSITISVNTVRGRNQVI